MLIEDMVKRPGSWLPMDRAAGVVVSSRIRLARNIKNVAFPEWAGEEESARVCSRLREVLGSVPELADAMFVDMAGLDPVDKEVLKERHLISNELAEKGRGSGVLVTADESVAIMINEEDHLRLQSICPGMNLRAVWERVNAVDSLIERQADYAFSGRLGYLTACPSNVGTGLRASVMVQLTGLKLTGEVEQVCKGMARLGLAVRGLLGEGTEAYGDMYQVSNQSTLGEGEDAIMEELIRLVNELVEHEQNARERLLEDRRLVLLDQAGRAYGTLLHARMLSSREAIDLLSVLKLGVECGIVSGMTSSGINEAILLVQPGHLQKLSKRLLNPQERDMSRADIVRQRLTSVSISE